MGITLTITAKGQVTLRKEVLRHLGVGPGDEVAVDLLPAGRVRLRAATAPGAIENFIGCLARPTSKRLSIEEISDLAARAWGGDR